MSVKIIAELNPYKRDRTRFTSSPKPISEIIKEINSGFPVSQARVCRDGEIVTDLSLCANDGDILWIKFVPYGESPRETGGWMKGGGWALMGLGALLIFSGIGSFIGAALIGTGLSMALGGTILMNTNIPSLEDKEKPEQNPSIRGGRNQARAHGRIPVLFGRHRIYPDLAANPHTQIIGNSQYYTQLFCGGYKDYEIDLDSFKLGDTPVIDLSQTKDISQILAGDDTLIKIEIMQNGEASNLYPHCVHEEALNVPLLNQIDDGDGNMISGEVIRTTPENTDKINIDIFFLNGIGKYNDSGDLVSASVEIKTSYKPAGSPDLEYQSLGFFNGSTNVITAAELKTRRFQVTKSGLVPGQYTVKIERITEDSQDSKIIDAVHVGSIRSVKSKDINGNIIRPIRQEKQKELTIIALRVMATAKLNGVIDSFNYVAQSKLPVFSGNGTGVLSWQNIEKTRNPAAMLLYALRGRASQQIVDPDDIDWTSLEAFYTWCEEHEYTCNAYLSESVTISELLRMIGNTARADVVKIDSKINVIQDIERPSHIQLFTPKNSISYSITMFSADVPDAIALRFIDEDAGFIQNELSVYNTPDGNRVSEPETIQKCDLFGVTDSVQARRIGMYNYGCIKNRPFVHTIEVDIEYLLCNKGDWIQYAGDIALTGSVQGRIKRVFFDYDTGYCTGVRLDELVETIPGVQYAVRIRLSNGTILFKNIEFIIDSNEVYFTNPLKGTIEEGDVYAFGIRGYEVIDLIITDIQPGQDLSAVLTCVEYSPEIFNVDKPDFILPQFQNKITPVSGAIDSGVINPDRWINFYTYHEGEEQPPRPTADGQSNGWHHVQTVQSRWVSTKRALSVDDGFWGPALAIRGEDGQFTDYRFAKNTSLNMAPPFTGQDTDNPGDNWEDIPPVISEGEYLWMITSDWRKEHRLTPWSLPTRISGPAGPVGQNAIYLHLDNENHSIACDANGNPIAGSLGFTVQAAVYDGTMAVTGTDVVWSLVSDCVNISINNSGTITVPENAVLDDTTLVTVIAIYKEVSFLSTLTLVKVRAGSYGLDGDDAVVFSIQPSVSVVRKNQNGTLDPSNVTCNQFIHVGNQITVSNERLMYRLSTMSSEAVYPAGGVNIGSAVWLDFILYHGSGMILDRQRIPVLSDGQDGMGIDALPRDAWAYYPCDDATDIFLPDNSGNNRHMAITEGITLAAGPDGRGAIEFDGSGAAYIQNTQELFYPEGDFTFALWIYKTTTGESQYVIANVESGGAGIQINANGAIQFRAMSGGVTYYLTLPITRVPDNTWLHIIAKYNAVTRVATAKINNVPDPVTLTLPAPIHWPTVARGVPVALGTNPGQFTATGAFVDQGSRFTGFLSDIAIFTRLTTDEEDEAMYKTRLIRSGVSRGITSIQYKFRLTNTAVMPNQNWSDSGWLTTAPSPDAVNRWLWYIERTTFTNNTTQDLTGLETIHGLTGLQGTLGNYHDLIYRRAPRDSLPGNSPPAAPPSVNMPDGWTNNPSSASGNDPLWMSRGIKNSQGVLQGAWSNPVIISGENGKDGLGIDSIPDDPWAYYPCDDLPDIPDNHAGQKYRGDPQWIGWSLGSADTLGNITNGILTIKTRSTLASALRPVITGGDILIARARQTDGVLNNLNFGIVSADGSAVRTAIGRLTRDWQIFSYVVPVGYNSIQYMDITNYTVAPTTLEISHLYIGNASYLVPLTDSSGNNRHMRISQGMLPALGPSGRSALNFLGNGAAYVQNTQELFYPEGDFTFALWINKTTTGVIQYAIANVQTGGVSINVNTNGTIRFGLYSDGAYRYLTLPITRVPDNIWLHIIAKYNSTTRVATAKINNVLDSVTLTLPAPIQWPVTDRGVPLTIGADPGQFSTAGIPSLTSFFSGLLSDIAIFTRLTTDREDEALYKSSLQKQYNPSIVSVPRYLGKTESPGNNNGVVEINSQFVIAKMGDWVAYVGADQSGTSIWKKGLCIRWTGVLWQQIPLSVDGNFESNPYMQAMFDLTADAPMGTFMTLLVQNLIAKTAMIESIFTEVLTVKNRIKSDAVDPVTGEPLFELLADGLLRAQRVDIEGHIKASSGTLNGVIIQEQALFHGRIFSDNFVIDYDPNSIVRFPASGTYPANTTIRTIRDNIYNFLGIPLNHYRHTFHFFDDGSYRGGRILSINFEYTSPHSIGFIATIITENGTYTFDFTNSPLGFTLWFQMGTGGKKMRFINLPLSAGNGASGTVFRDDHGNGISTIMIKN